MQFKTATILILMLSVFAACAAPQPPACEPIELGVDKFDGSGWDTSPAGTLIADRPGARVQIELHEALAGAVDHVEIYASGYELIPTFVGVTASIVGSDPATGETQVIGDVVTTGGMFPPTMQALTLPVAPEAYDWPETLLVITATGSPGSREFAGATLFPACIE